MLLHERGGMDLRKRGITEGPARADRPWRPACPTTWIFPNGNFKIGPPVQPTTRTNDEETAMAGFLDRAKEQAQRGLTQGKQKLDDVQAQRAGADLLKSLGAAYLRGAARQRLPAGHAAGPPGRGEPHRDARGRLSARLRSARTADRIGSHAVRRSGSDRGDPGTSSGTRRPRPAAVAACEGGGHGPTHVRGQLPEPAQGGRRSPSSRSATGSITTATTRARGARSTA